MVLEKPKELSWVEAAALPENWMTGQFHHHSHHLCSIGPHQLLSPLAPVWSRLMMIAYQALVVEGGMKKGDNVLIHAVSLCHFIDRRMH